MGRSLHIGTYAGIPVFVHWTFGLLVLGVAYFTVYLGFDSTATVWFSAYMFTLFFCVILHEYGHALMARRFGVGTRDIIISPIGGLARLESIPTNPKQELLIAFAGPIVNVIIAVFLVAIMSIVKMQLIPEDILHFPFPRNLTDFLQLVLGLNIVLFFFNLIPAFPMDGGRVLRALLAIKFEYKKATLIASVIGRIFAVGFIIAGIYVMSPLWVFIGVFIFFMAKKEYEHVKRSTTLKTTTIKDISNYNYTLLRTDDLIQKAIDQYKLTQERSYLIQDLEGTVVGSLPEVIIQFALKENRVHEPISNFMSSKLHDVNEETSVFDAFNLLDKNDLGVLTVKKGNAIVAVLDREAVKGFLRGL